LPSIWPGVRAGDVAAVQDMLVEGAFIDEDNNEGRTPLMIACASGDTPMVRLLVEETHPPANLAARAAESWTPLMIACGAGALEVVKVLVNAGAGLGDSDTTFGSTPLMWACGGGHHNVVRYMLDTCPTSGLLQARNKEGCCPLMITCDGGDLKTVQVLVDAGADLKAFNLEGLTALDLATRSGSRAVEHFLKKRGATRSRDFWEAIETGDTPTVEDFLHSNSHLVRAVDKAGRTALLLACLGGHSSLVETLVRTGAEVDFQDTCGTCPLNVAVLLGNISL
ncbi:unnamed protein product, partial [Discosporangium mesarthrocarpum]